ncbi:hypothetical protein A0J57_23570 [Sphingobium sp. 22B]|nr:hypothetical protein AXW74_22340 [Sphingobium sp. AM]KYC29857.1 hypothetical protein A0J57_23570 [Sphingobium sp. 22B]OAP29465.1 hypothetical protein A8O16_23565 [Sphingobium sp. 20006FA]
MPISNLTLPDCSHVPTEGAQLRFLTRVPLAIRIELRPPIIEFGFGSPSLLALVTVPKAAVHKDRLFAAGQYYIGTPRKLFWMEPVAVA